MIAQSREIASRARRQLPELGVVTLVGVWERTAQAPTGDQWVWILAVLILIIPIKDWNVRPTVKSAASQQNCSQTPGPSEMFSWAVHSKVVRRVRLTTWLWWNQITATHSELDSFGSGNVNLPWATSEGNGDSVQFIFIYPASVTIQIVSSGFIETQGLTPSKKQRHGKTPL